MRARFARRTIVTRGFRDSRVFDTSAILTQPLNTRADIRRRMACSSKELPLDYLKTPDTAAFKRYNEKHNLLGGEDPYSMGSDS